MRVYASRVGVAAVSRRHRSHTGEDIKRANDELRKLPERPKKLEEPKSCAACGAEKPRGNYSKAQWKASSSSRRCLGCVAANRNVSRSRSGSAASMGSAVSRVSTTVTDEDEGVGAMFAEAEETVVAKVEPKETVARPPSPPAVVWSGATPREKLEQWCRERGNPKPSYEVASRTTVRCRVWACLLYTSPSPRDRQKSRMPSSA